MASPSVVTTWICIGTRIDGHPSRPTLQDIDSCSSLICVNLRPFHPGEFRGCGCCLFSALFVSFRRLPRRRTFGELSRVALRRRGYSCLPPITNHQSLLTSHFSPLTSHLSPPPTPGSLDWRITNFIGKIVFNGPFSFNNAATAIRPFSSND